VTKKKESPFVRDRKKGTRSLKRSFDESAQKGKPEKRGGKRGVLASTHALRGEGRRGHFDALLKRKKGKICWKRERRQFGTHSSSSSGRGGKKRQLYSMHARRGKGTGYYRFGKKDLVRGKGEKNEATFLPVRKKRGGEESPSSLIPRRKRGKREETRNAKVWGRGTFGKKKKKRSPL